MNAFDKATVHAYPGATVNAEGESTVTVYQGAHVTVGAHATAVLKNGAQLDAKEGAVLHLPDNTIVAVTGDTHLMFEVTGMAQTITVNGGAIRMANPGSDTTMIRTISPSDDTHPKHLVGEPLSLRERVPAGG
ncbi:hypothetical protein EO087_10505 [Dyella sp. M7H15-1]|uniref:hypothetical protein n=1 Tax=Dyella sp. M7H15-1 TaxID=2501295 RepID=UPI001004DC8C|nr:hypothetical protein [Dyella sp. M7H15-1]QAU24368.1 hypothetical protein EO087_10505 [Dyella sp. M7H15-1]